MRRYDCDGGPDTLEEQLACARARIREIEAHILTLRGNVTATPNRSKYLGHWRRKLAGYVDWAEWLEEQIRKESE